MVGDGEIFYGHFLIFIRAVSLYDTHQWRTELSSLSSQSWYGCIFTQLFVFITESRDYDDTV
ncbi:hypothetical protein Pla144_06340 [Bythopirellula polymerisocia]|uniref:Uncharacterized protein n=1 Tax=Bythopirellula polymerisocia TaxID=2528003 RepID=A0A5C6D1Y8_9BACT|nr:hypothetical protein Pla144_06340 [Bythopirellula polymerisocia]